MSTINDGGTAFPTQNMLGGFCGGMTLRDYFAASALTALLLSETAQSELATAVAKKYAERPEEDRRHIANAILAKRSYWLADAMLAEKAKAGVA